MDNYVAEFNGITEKLDNGRDVCDLMTGFWEKLAKIEHGYAKQLEDLCKGRFARLETLLGQTKLMFAKGSEKPSQPAALEHIGSLQDCWIKVVGEVQRLASEHEILGSHIHSKVSPTITKFVREKLKDETSKTATGKRLLTEARTSFQRVTATKRKYFADVAAARATGGDGDEDSIEPPSKAAYRTAVEDLASKHEEVFNVGLPGVLRDINVIEQDRAQMLCSCMNQYTQAAAALKNALTFDATAAALEATTKDPAVTQLVMMSPPPAKAVVEEASEEAIAQEQEEAQSTSLMSTMSGWLKRSTTSESASASSSTTTTKERSSSDAAAATTPSEEKESTTSKITSFFSGWGRKSKPAPAQEPVVDAPGLVDSVDGADEETQSKAESAEPDSTTAAVDEPEESEAPGEAAAAPPETGQDAGEMGENDSD